MTTITALPTPPSRDDPANFATEADAFLGALPTFVTEANLVAGEVNTNAGAATTQAGIATTQAGNASTSAGTATTKAGEANASAIAALASENAAANYAAALNATSTTSLAIATGSKAFTTQASKQFATGQFIVAVDAASNANYMHGQVTSYSGTSLVIDVQSIGGSGTKADWKIYVAGNRGATGAGDVTGPGSSTSGNLPSFNGTGGKTLQDSGVAASTVGTKNVPISSTTTTLVVADVGKCVSLSAGITIPNSTFAAGDIVSLYNNTSGTITITCTITTAYIAGTDSDKATMTLAARGLATILFISGTVCVVSGNVS
jgi:hypothetical protein